MIKTTFDLYNNDPGADWVIGDTAGLTQYEGRFDTFKIERGKVHALECIAYYDHIATLLTDGETVDKISYMLHDIDPKVYIIVHNDDGDEEKMATLAYLVEEWLVMSEYVILTSFNLPLEERMGLWHGIFEM